MKQFSLIVFTFLLTSFSFSQNYKKVDSIVKEYPKKFRSIKHLANRIDNDFVEDIDRVRAAYYWISNNIIYNYKAYRSGKNGYKSIKVKTELDYKKRFLEMQKKYAEKVLKKNTGVCEGYSQLMRFTLLELNIECLVLSGYAKNSVHYIGIIQRRTDHAWNVVKIDSVWKLIDATWSTGNREGATSFFNFSDEYFLTSPKNMILTHFPKDNKWQLLDIPITKKTFFYKPLFYDNYFDLDFKLNEKQSGIIKAKSKKIIVLKFDKINESKRISYAFEKDEYSTEIHFIEKNNNYIARIPFNYKRKTYLSLFDGLNAIIEFKVIPSK